MKGFKISDIIKIVLGDILLELYFNIENSKHQKLSFKISISDDGETIHFSQQSDWFKLENIKYTAYSGIRVDRNRDELGRLINNEIKYVKYGVGQELNTNRLVVYYFKIITDKNEFLFFNNGDSGSYSIDKIDEILSNDIYGYEWVDVLPANVI